MVAKKSPFEQRLEQLQHPDAETQDKLKAAWREIHQTLELSQIVARDLFGYDATPDVVLQVYDRAIDAIDVALDDGDEEDYDEDEDYED